MLKINLIFVLALIFALIQCKTVENSMPSVEVSATHLISDYEEDKSLADQKYKGKSVILSGEASHFAVLRGVIGVYFKSSDTTSQFQAICFIDMESHPSDYSKIVESLNRTFTGTIKDSSASSINISDCHLAE